MPLGRVLVAWVLRAGGFGRIPTGGEVAVDDTIGEFAGEIVYIDLGRSEGRGI